MKALMTARWNVRSVVFNCKEEVLVGRLWVPEGNGPHRGLVITGAWMTVKEQMAARYAQEMVSRGFVVLTFDYRGWGESGGARRQLEDPASKIEDLLAAVGYLQSFPEVSGPKVGCLGICAGSGYVVHAALRSPQIGAVGLVAPWLQSREIVDAVYGGSEMVQALIEKGRLAEKAYQVSGLQAFVPAASTTDSSAIMFGAPYYTEPNRGMIPEWRNEVDTAFWERWLTFDAHVVAGDLKQPFAMVHSEAAAIPTGAYQFYDAVTAEKSETWIPDVVQFDFYDREDAVTLAADKMAKHFAKHLVADETWTVIRTVNQVGARADAKDWEALRSLFADEVYVDYTSVAGGEPGVVKADDLVAGWMIGLGQFEVTKHRVGKHVVVIDGDLATCDAEVTATHVKPDGSRWTCGGTYHYELRNMKVCRTEFHMDWQQA